MPDPNKTFGGTLTQQERIAEMLRREAEMQAIMKQKAAAADLQKRGWQNSGPGMTGQWSATNPMPPSPNGSYGASLTNQERGMMASGAPNPNAPPMQPQQAAPGGIQALIDMLRNKMFGATYSADELKQRMPRDLRQWQLHNQERAVEGQKAQTYEDWKKENP